jgi:hypothetical protein
LNNGLATISKRSWNGAGIGARKLLGILSPGASGKKVRRTRRAPELLDLGERDAVIFFDADRTELLRGPHQDLATVKLLQDIE